MWQDKRNNKKDRRIKMMGFIFGYFLGSISMLVIMAVLIIGDDD